MCSLRRDRSGEKRSNACEKTTGLLRLSGWYVVRGYDGICYSYISLHILCCSRSISRFPWQAWSRAAETILRHLEAEGKQLLGEVGVRVRVRGKFRLSPSLHVHTTYRFLAVRVSSCGRWSVCLAVGYGTNQGRKSRALSRRYAITATSA